MSKQNETHEVQVTVSGETDTLVWSGSSERDLWKVVGEHLADPDISALPGPVEVTVPGNGTAMLTRTAHGSLKPGKSTITLDPCEYPVKKFIKIDAETNTHQMYELMPNGFPGKHLTLEIGAMWGATGGNGGGDAIEDMFTLKYPWPAWFYEVKSADLKARGYEDLSDLMIDEQEILEEFQHCFGEEEMNLPDDDPAIELYTRLKGEARAFLSDTLGVEKDFLAARSPYSRVQTKSARKIHAHMASQMAMIGGPDKADSIKSLAWLSLVNEFNRDSEKLIALTGIPFHTSDADGRNRRSRKVSDFVVNSTAGTQHDQADRMETLLDFWNTVISAMEAVSHGTETAAAKQKDQDESTGRDYGPFGDCRVTLEDPETARKLLDQFHAPDQFQYRMYRIEPHDFEARQKQYRESTGADKTLLLLHGSPNPNWISLIRTHPVRNPGFVTAGKALGWASAYLARDFMKSLHYTSLPAGMYNTGSKGQVGYMAIFSVAYRKVFYPDHAYDCEQDMREAGCDLVDARASRTGWAMDELTVYDDAQLCMKELIEITM